MGCSENKVFSINAGNSLYAQKLCNPSYGDPQSGSTILWKSPPVANGDLVCTVPGFRFGFNADAWAPRMGLYTGCPDYQNMLHTCKLK